MAIELISTQNTKIDVKLGSPLTYQLWDGITTMQFTGGERTTIDGTAISDAEPRGVTGPATPYEASGRCNFDPNDPVHAALEAAKQAGTKLLFRITLNAETPIIQYMDARVADFGNYSLENNAIVECAFKLVLDGGRRATEA